MRKRSYDKADVASLMLRLGLGPMLIAHGSNKVWGKGGLEGTTGWFEALGLRPAAIHARLAATTELSTGSLLIAGALAPLPEAAAIGLMATAAVTDHRGKGFFVFKGGWEYVAVVALTCAALADLGHGKWSVDAVVGNNRRGPGWAAAATALGVGVAAALVKATYTPPEEPGS
jgi:putative oxidoreductase